MAASTHDRAWSQCPALSVGGDNDDDADIYITKGRNCIKTLEDKKKDFGNVLELCNVPNYISCTCTHRL